ncbi:hypothetical protein, partial [Streptomyces sp. NPDC056549]|uniref:hypothetical protein n=1 Tax=Streptomyces sp. NPDC056549 TaxID=3345864 RepID=UPI0036C41ECB
DRRSPPGGAMRTICRNGWTAADYDSEQILHELGHRDAAARVSRARRRSARWAWRWLRARFHRLAASMPPKLPALRG